MPFAPTQPLAWIASRHSSSRPCVTFCYRRKPAERIKATINRTKTKRSKQVSNDERKLTALRQKIERGSENLALAEREDFAAISKLLNQWREEESAITERIENANKHLEPLPETIDMI
jgi:BMFP domain-containing protein YqiC